MQAAGEEAGPAEAEGDLGMARLPAITCADFIAVPGGRDYSHGRFEGKETSLAPSLLHVILPPSAFLSPPWVRLSLKSFLCCPRLWAERQTLGTRDIPTNCARLERMLGTNAKVAFLAVPSRLLLPDFLILGTRTQHWPKMRNLYES